MQRRNFLKSFIAVPVMIAVPKIMKKKEFRNDFEYNMIYIYKRKEFYIPSKECLALYQSPTYYSIGLQVFHKYKNINEFIVKQNSEKGMLRLSVDIIDKALLDLKEWFDYEIRPAGIFFQYENYNKVL